MVGGVVNQSIEVALTADSKVQVSDTANPGPVGDSDLINWK